MLPRVLSYTLILLVQLSLVACGQKSNALIGPHQVPVGDQYNEGLLQNCSYQYDSNLGAKIDNLINNSNRVRDLLKAINPAYNLIYSYNIYPNQSNLTARFPLRNSVEIHGAYLNTIARELQTYKSGLYYSWLIEGVSVDENVIRENVTPWDESFLAQIEARIRGLGEIKRRWISDMCQKEHLAANSRYDIRSYSLLKQGQCGSGILIYESEGVMETGCLQQILTTWKDTTARLPNLSKFTQEHMEKACIAVQGQVQTQIGECVLAFTRFAEQAKLLELWNILEQTYQAQYLSHYYSIRNANRDFVCQEIEGIKKLTVKIYLDDLATTDKLKIIRDLNTLVKRKWSRSHKYEISFKLVNSESIDDKTLRINIRPGIISHVVSNNPWMIHLGRDSFENNARRPVELAHELGHVFGFPDCYVNFYQRHLDQTTYYILDENNLMCNSSQLASIPDSYFEELFDKRCQR